MHVRSPDLSGGALRLSRREFLGSCSVLALCLSGCQSVGPRTRFATRMLVDPPARQYRPVLRGLLHALLPFEHPRFPAVAPERVEARLLDLFPIDAGEQFSAFQRGLLFFDDLALFPHLFGPLVRAEQAGRADPEASAAGPWTEEVGRLRAEEQERYARFRAGLGGAADRFVELPLDEQRAYLRMWNASGLTAKRQFARSAKSLVMIAAYSMEEMWHAIGYAGPLLQDGHATA